MPAAPAPFAYDAFISYSRTAGVTPRSRKYLRRGWSAFAPPRGIARSDGSPVKSRHLRIFRDQQDLHGTRLSESLEQAIHKSRHIIVVGSPQACADDRGRIAQEIDWFAKHHGTDGAVPRDGIIPVLIAGRPSLEVRNEEAQDQAFHERIYKYVEDPLAADFRAVGGGLQRRERQREAKLHLLAILLDTSKEELARRQQQRQLRLYSAVTAILLTVAGALAGLTVYAFAQREVAERHPFIADHVRSRRSTPARLSRRAPGDP